jgi:small-conductance mechanosensitive channel
MNFHFNPDTQAALISIARLLGAVLASQVFHLLLYSFLRHRAHRHNSIFAEQIITHTQLVTRLLFLLLSISIVMPKLELPDWFYDPLSHTLVIGYILLLAWFAIAVIEVLNAVINEALPQNLAEDFRARRRHTRTRLLRQIAIGLIFFAAGAAILMTFPSIRNLGAGLFASAGLAGLVLGMAARPTLGNLIAGIQVALTEPIRIEDAVVVEGEMGRVIEVNTTYVIVRTWDLRNLIVPLSYFIEKPFQNWTRYSSDLIGVVLLYTDYSVPIDELRAEHQRILESSPLWDRKVSAVQVTDAKEHSVELRFLMGASNPASAFELRCYVREKLIQFLQKNYPEALPRVRSEVSLLTRDTNHTPANAQPRRRVGADISSV